MSLVSMRRILLFVATLCGAGEAASVGPDTYDAADPSAPEVTAENLLESERFWPYRVSLVSDWQPAGGPAAIPAGTRGILVRVEPSGSARIDFGRIGRFETPLERLDVVALANRVRLGEEKKLAPNFVHTVGTRLVESDAPNIRPVPLEKLYEPARFLAVFADPSSSGFPALAASLAPLRMAPRTETVLFAQGRHDDRALWSRLRTLDWPVSFLRDEYGEGYTRSLRADGAPLPAVMLVTREGRVLLDRPWSDAVVRELEALIGTAPKAGDAPSTTPARSPAKTLEKP